MSEEKRCVQILRQIRPQWKKCDIILRKLTVKAWIGYSINNMKDKLFIKLYENETLAKTEKRKAQIFSDIGVSPKILGTFSHGYVSQYQTRSDPELLHHNSVYPLVAASVGTLHRKLSQITVEKREVGIFETLSMLLSSVTSDDNNNHFNNNYSNSSLNLSYHDSLPNPLDVFDELTQLQVLKIKEVKTKLDHIFPGNSV